MAAVASRYARAFADVVIDKQLDPEQARQQILAIVSLVRSSPELRSVWKSPAISQDQKLRLLDTIAKKMELVRQVRDFVAVLIDHKRIQVLPEIASDFEREVNDRLGLVDAEVTSARELAAEEKRTLEEQIGRLAGKRVRAQYFKDASVLGGAVVKVGSTVYDGSLRGQLQRMKELLSAD